MSNLVRVYDATLRDGRQGVGFNLSLAGMCQVATLLDRVGVDYIEAGWPGADKLWDDFMAVIGRGELSLVNSKLVSFGSTRRAKLTVETDELLRKVVDAPVPVVTLFGKCWDRHVIDALQTSLETNLQMVEQSCRFASLAGKEVIFDAEHFFQGYLEGDRSYSLDVLNAACQGGATTLALCDTNGIAYPWDIEIVLADVTKRFGSVATIGVHLHNDRGMADANTLKAIRCGARHLQGTFNGHAERSGMASTATILANLHLKGQDWRVQLSPSFTPEQLTSVSHEINALAGLRANHCQPFVGNSTAAHVAGVHTSALGRGGGKMYQSHDPLIFGQSPRIVLSSLAGRASVVAFAHSMLKTEVTDQQTCQILDLIVVNESKGYRYDTCSASSTLLVARCLWPDRHYPLENVGGFVHSSLESSSSGSIANIRSDDGRLRAGEGNGPVDAIANAILWSLADSHPARELRFVRYDPHQLADQPGSSATMRVEVTWHHPMLGELVTQGVSPNILKASELAVVEAVQYVSLMSNIE